MAWSYLWLGRAALQAGRAAEAGALHQRLVEILEMFKGQLLVASTRAQQSRDLAELEDLINPLFAFVGARSTPSGLRPKS